ncbi:MAG: NUDIX hydrolase [Candidatus Adiutrix sp.]|jgi:8-oxo-dGTP pyrophosphatase MutT (NUDIX family)|nr:NUDIX hydrolase [Candidatus Adiutrix sp.]
MPVKEWPLLADEEILKTPVFTLRRHSCLSPKDGRSKDFTVLDVREWVQVLAVTEDRQALLVRQFREGARRLSLELPGGVQEAGQSLEETARRELMEETGYSAENWRRLVTFRANPAIQNNSAHVFVAEGARLTGRTNFDENEDLDLISLPLDSLKAMVLDGRIDHVIMAAAILFYFNSL